MSALRSLQREFQSFLLKPSSAMELVVVGTRRASARTRLAIYVDGYRLRLVKALEGDFPTLLAWLGSEGFRSLAAAYVDACPPRHFSIRYYGERVARFLREDAGYCEMPFLAEMAEFDWAIGTAFDAPDGPIADEAAVAAIPAELWPELRFRLHPTVQRTDLRWNVPALRKAVEDGAPVAEPQAYPQPVGWVIWRRDLRTYFRSLSVPERWALGAVHDGESFAEICEGLCAWLPEERVALQAAGFLRRWVEEGMVSSFESRG
jgi:Putative DNA-binding domain